MTDFIKNAIINANTISKADFVIEDYKEATYKLVLEYFLSSQDKTEIHPTNDQIQTLKDDLKHWEKKIIENLPSASVTANGNRDQQTIWAAVKLYANNEEATRHSVPKIIKDGLGVTPQTGNNTSRKLKKLVPKYLNRKQEGKKYNYEPTKDALKIFED